MRPARRIISSRLAKARSDFGLDQDELAACIGVSERTVRRWEHGERVPPADRVRDLAQLFRVSADYLLGLTQDHEPPN
jgi:transcriptional regulator with XRE-family HTH domain